MNSNTTQLDKVMNFHLAMNNNDRYLALESVKKSFDIEGPYQVAYTHNVLVNDSAEEFAMQFMTAYNNEICPVY